MTDNANEQNLWLENLPHWQPVENARERIASLLARPSASTWQDAYMVIVTCFGGECFTLWRAVVAVDSSFPSTKPLGTAWHTSPLPDTIVRALRFSLKKYDSL